MNDTFYLTRLATLDDGTFGELSDGVFFCKTAELPFYGGDASKKNEQRVDCIPPGTYECSMTDSPKFGKVYMVRNVPGRSHILIHAGNYSGDKGKGKRSDVEGCILLGNNYGILRDQTVVVNSKKTLEAFHAYTKMRPFTLIIRQPEDWV